MKAEKRKQLQTNALASRMSTMVTSIKKQSPRRTALYVILFIGLLVTLFVVFRYFRGRSEAAADRWVMFEASDPGEAAKLIRNYPDTQPGIAARFQFAWVQLWQQGIKRLVGDSEKARASLKSAYEEYKKLAKEVDGDPMYHPEALYAIAVILETNAVVDRDELKAARKQYLLVHEKYPNSAFGLRAMKRARLLDPESESYIEIARFYQNMSLFVQVRALPKGHPPIPK